MRFRREVHVRFTYKVRDMEKAKLFKGHVANLAQVKMANDHLIQGLVLFGTVRPFLQMFKAGNFHNMELKPCSYGVKSECVCLFGREVRKIRHFDLFSQ